MTLLISILAPPICKKVITDFQSAAVAQNGSHLEHIRLSLSIIPQDLPRCEYLGVNIEEVQHMLARRNGCQLILNDLNCVCIPLPFKVRIVRVEIFLTGSLV